MSRTACDRSDRGRGRGLTVAVALAAVLCAHDAMAQRAPAVVQAVDVSSLAGDWYEVATTGTWWHRHCVSDTRYGFDMPARAGLRVTSVCSTAQGVARYRGALRAATASDGRLAIRFTPPIFNWLPATWSDFWILEAGEDLQWLLVGDNRRERLLVLSRTVAIDEASMAQALAAARREGYVVDHLATVPHPAGPTGLLPRR